MFNAIKKAFKAIVRIFTGGGGSSVPSTPAPPVEAPAQPPIITQPVEGEPDWKDWTKKAMVMSGAFEGEGEDWGNPVGNFDGAYLTCGLLGFTWKWNNQPPMILTFVKRHGEARARQLMPRVWDDYYRAAKLGESGGKSIVSRWSSGRSNDDSVYEPYRTELKNFWSSEEMRVIQVEKAWEMMGAWAKEKSIVAQKYWNLPTPLFQHFEYYFDQAVLNGQANYIKLSDASALSLSTVLDFCASKGGYTVKDLRRNGDLWPKLIPDADNHEVVLWKAAYLRARFSRSEFQAVTMNRRGTLALGRGYVNGTLRTYYWLGRGELSNSPTRTALEKMIDK